MKNSKNSVFTVVMLVAFALLIVFAIVFFSKTDFVSFSEFLESFINREQNVSLLPGDEGKIYEAITQGKYIPGIEIYSGITQENARELILGIKGKNSYVWESKSTVYADTGNISSFCTIRHYNGKYLAEMLDSEGKTKKTVYDNLLHTTVTSYERLANGERAQFPSGSLDIFSQSGIANVKEFLSLPQDKEYTISQVNSEWGSLLLVEFFYEDGNFMQKEAYYISLDYGLVLRAESYDGGALSYLLETISLSDEIPVEEYFTE